MDDQGEVVGFFEFFHHDGVLQIGLGLHPDLTRRGDGLSFVMAGLSFATNKFALKLFKLSVATFNVRAIKVYERAGFRETRTFWNEINSSVYEFVEMSREPL